MTAESDALVTQAVEDTRAEVTKMLDELVMGPLAKTAITEMVTTLVQGLAGAIQKLGDENKQLRAKLGAS